MYRNRDYSFQISSNKCNVHICQFLKKQIQSPTQSTIWMIRRSCDNFKVKLWLYLVYMKLAPLQAKAPLKWPHIHHCNIQSNVHHLELHGIESRVVLLKQIFEAEKAQPYLHNLVICAQSFHFEDMDCIDPLDQIPIFQKPA